MPTKIEWLQIMFYQSNHCTSVPLYNNTLSSRLKIRENIIIQELIQTLLKDYDFQMLISNLGILKLKIN